MCLFILNFLFVCLFTDVVATTVTIFSPFGVVMSIVKKMCSCVKTIYFLISLSLLNYLELKLDDSHIH